MDCKHLFHAMIKWVYCATSVQIIPKFLFNAWWLGKDTVYHAPIMKFLGKRSYLMKYSYKPCL